MNIDLKNLLKWSAPKRVRTSQGERDLLIALPTLEFRALWKSNKEALKAAGISWSKKTETDETTGLEVEIWEVMWWRQLDAAELAQKAATLEASKAVDADVEIPRPAGREYLGYQKAGIAFAAAREGTLLADEMGLGKTIQAIGLINSDKSIKNVLIVCPASLKINWSRELRRWLTRPLSIQIVGSGAGWGKADITLINYEMLAKYSQSIEGRMFDLAVVDESHRVKNPKAQCTKAFQLIQAKRRMAMTGTPLKNGRPIELWTTLVWLDPKRWHKRSGYFQTRYCGAFQSQWGWVNDGATHLDELQEVLRTSVMVRRLKKDVLTELPAKVRSVIELEGNANARKAAKAELEKWQQYESAIKAAQAAIDTAQDQAAYETAVAALKEAQGIAFEAMSKVRHETAVAKVPFVLDFVQEILEDSDEKLVVFAHHVDVVDALMAGLAEFGAVKLVGGMTDKAKQASVDRFQGDASCRVFIGNIQAAGEGITLTASSHVVFAELDWTPARLSQAEDRCHRIGQFDSVQVQHLVLEESLDAYMAEMLVDKQRNADKALDKSAKPIEIKAQATEITVKEQPELKLNGMSAEQVAAAHQAMKMLAGVCDGARSWDAQGFNKLDTDFGKSLAYAPALSAKQAAFAAKLANKYRRQLPEDLLKVILG